MLIYYETDRFDKAVRVKAHPRRTPRGLTWVQEYERTEPKTVGRIDLHRNVHEVLNELQDVLQQFAPTNHKLVEVSVKHYFGNFLVPIMTYQGLKEKGQIDETKYNELLATKQKEFQTLFGKVKEAITMERIRPYQEGIPFYEIGKSRRLSYGI